MRWSKTGPKGASQRNSLNRLLIIGTLSVGIVGAFLCAPAFTARLPNNRIAFDRSPELVEASILSPVMARDGQFEIVIEMPINAGEPLQALVVHPRSEEACFAFDPAATEAYLSKPSAELAAVPLASVGGMMMSPNEVLVVFETPIEPGNQVTVVLQPKHSPLPGIYEFGVTAYPAGDSPVGQFLGYEVLQF